MMNRTPSTLLSGSQFLQPITITISLSANEKYTSVISHSSPRFVRVDEALADVPRRASGDLVRWILVPVGAAVRVGLILARGVVLLDEPIPQFGALFPLLFTRAVDQECHRVVIVVEKDPRRCHLRWYVPQDRLLVDLKNNIASDERPEYG